MKLALNYKQKTVWQFSQTVFICYKNYQLLQLKRELNNWYWNFGDYFSSANSKSRTDGGLNKFYKSENKKTVFIVNN